MYRILKPEGRIPIRAIAREIGKEYPDYFEPQLDVRPHVSILSLGAAKSFLNHGSIRSNDLPYQTIREVYTSLRPKAPKSVNAKCTDVNYFGSSLGIVIDAPEVDWEIKYAFEAVEEIAGEDIRVDRTAHIILGSLISTPGFSLTLGEREHMLTYAAQACGDLLPDNRVALLGKLTLTQP